MKSNPMTWSVSDSYLLASCPRAMYHKRERHRAGTKFEASIPLHSIVGLSVHKAIASQLSRWQSGDEVSARDAEEEASAILYSIWTSRQHSIVEILNGVPIGEGLVEDLDRISRLRTKTFFRMIWPNYQSHTHVSHEIDDGFELGNAYVSVRIDLLSKDRDGTYVISDWKTGEPRDSDEHQFQMNTYALYAHSKLGISEDSLQTKLVFLRTGDTVVSRPPKSELQSVVARIRSEVSLLTPPIDISQFPAKPTHRLCISCSFLWICIDGKKHVESRKNELAGLETPEIDME